MNIDEKIKRELESDDDIIDALMKDDSGLMDMMMSTLKGSLSRWVALVFVITLVVSGFMVWCGYEFIVARNTDDRVFWGVWALILLNMQIALKQWTWTEAHRGSLVREFKRMEVELTRLKAAMGKSP